MKNTAEKDRQTQILAVFALIGVLSGPGWKSMDEIVLGMRKRRFSRCPRTIRRVMNALKKAGVEISVNRKAVPHTYRIKKRCASIPLP